MKPHVGLSALASMFWVLVYGCAPALVPVLAPPTLQPGRSQLLPQATFSPVPLATADLRANTSVPPSGGLPTLIFSSSPNPKPTQSPSLLMKGSDSNVNLVPNGSFETVNSGWTTQTSMPGITMQWTTAWAKTGSYSVMIGDLPAAGPTNMPTANWISDLIPVTPNSLYVAGFAYCSAKGQVVQWTVAAFGSNRQRVGMTNAGGVSSRTPNCNGEMHSTFVPSVLRDGTNPSVAYVTVAVGVTNPIISPLAPGPTYFDDVYLYLSK